MSEQKINVKNTYVATVKSDIVDKALSFYTNNKSSDIFVEDSIFPSIADADGFNLNTAINNAEIANDENKDVQNIVVPSELTNIDTVAENFVVEKPQVNNVETTNSTANQVNADSIMDNSSVSYDIPNLSVLEPIPNAPSTPVAPQPIPNPVDTPINPIPIDDNHSNVETMVNESIVQPARFDASHETNLLDALGENNNKNNIGNISVTPENLSIVREFGVDEPIVNSQESVSNASTGGFVNSKILLFVVIILFLASCVFLGYEIYNYFILTK